MLVADTRDGYCVVAVYCTSISRDALTSLLWFMNLLYNVFLQLYSSQQGFDWHRASHSPSVVAELFVCHCNCKMCTVCYMVMWGASVCCVLCSLQPRTTGLLNGLSSRNAHNAKQLSDAWDTDRTCELHSQCSRFVLLWWHIICMKHNTAGHSWLETTAIWEISLQALCLLWQPLWYTAVASALRCSPLL